MLKVREPVRWITSSKDYFNQDRFDFVWYANLIKERERIGKLLKLDKKDMEEIIDEMEKDCWLRTDYQ